MGSMRMRRWLRSLQERNVAEAQHQPAEDDFLNILLTMVAGTVVIVVQQADDTPNDQSSSG